MCGRDIATSAVVSTKMEFVEIPARSPGTHVNWLEKHAALISINGKAGPDELRSFHLCKSILLFPLFVSSVCFVG